MYVPSLDYVLWSPIIKYQYYYSRYCWRASPFARSQILAAEAAAAAAASVEYDIIVVVKLHETNVLLSFWLPVNICSLGMGLYTKTVLHDWC